MASMPGTAKPPSWGTPSGPPASPGSHRPGGPTARLVPNSTKRRAPPKPPNPGEKDQAPKPRGGNIQVAVGSHPCRASDCRLELEFRPTPEFRPRSIGASVRARAFFRAAYSDNCMRREDRRSLARDLLLHAVNVALRPIENQQLRRARGVEPGVVFLVGTPRAGTTLLFQLLARYCDYTYVPNFAARFWLVPVTGLKLYRLRFPRAVDRGELVSHLGRTFGPHAPHEFSYFWHYWMGPAESDDRTAAELERVDWQAIRSEICGLYHDFGRPVLFKSLNFVDYHVPQVAALLPSASFVWIRRDPRFVAQSILESRRRRYGDPCRWWSVRPRAAARWSQLGPVEQVVRQIVDIERALERAFAALPAGRRVVIQYESLVAAPSEATARLMGALGGNASSSTRAPELAELHLPDRNKTRAEVEEWRQIERMLERVA